jgi:hypothetical protein
MESMSRMLSFCKTWLKDRMKSSRKKTKKYNINSPCLSNRERGWFKEASHVLLGA